MIGLGFFLHPYALIVYAAVFALGWSFNQGRHFQERIDIHKAAVEEQAKKKAIDAEVAEATEARRGAELPGSILRLKKEWCRDCE